MANLDVETMATSLLCDSDALKRMYSLGLRKVHFQSLDNKEAYDFAIKYWRDSGFEKAPTKQVLEAKTDVIVGEVDESPVFVVEELKRQYIRRRTKEIMVSSLDNVKDDPDGAISLLSNELWKLKQNTAERYGESDLVSNIDDRRKRYTERSKRSSKGLLGETLGFDEVDKLTSGMMPGELWIVAAGPKVGKTWYSLQVMRKAMEQGKKVLYFSLEMPIDDMEDRLEALLSGVSYNQLTKGTLESVDVQKLRAVQDAEKDMGRIMFRRPSYGDRTVQNMIRIAKEDRPDIMIIDQLSWIESDDANGRSEQIAKIILELKACISDDEDFRIPTLLLTQFNRAGASAGEAADLSQLALSSEIERTADAIISFSRTKEQAANNALVMQILASRRCDQAKWLLHRELYNRTEFNVVRQIVDGDED